MDDVNPHLHIRNATKIHLYICLHGRAGVFHVVHQRAIDPEDTIRVVCTLDDRDVVMPAGAPVDIVEGGPIIELTSPREPVVSVDGMALGTILFEEPPTN